MKMRYSKNTLSKGAVKTGEIKFETYIKVKNEWKYLYKTADPKGNAINFLLIAKKDKEAAKRFVTSL